MTRIFDPASLWEHPRRMDARTAQLIDDSPELIWLHQFAKHCRTRLDLQLEPAAALKAAVLRARITAAGWRLLTRATPEDILVVLRHPNARQRPWSLVMDWINCHTELGLTSFYPPAVSAVLIDQSITQLNARPDLKRLPMVYPEPFFTALHSEAATRLAAGTLDELASTELPLVILWVGSDDERAIRLTSRTRWPAQYRAAKRWRAETEARERHATTNWTSLLLHTSFRHLYATALDNGYLLLEEGFKMRHCLGGLTRLAVSGQSRFFSLRESGSDRRIATIEIQCLKGRWTLFDMRTACNRPAGTELLFYGERVAKSYNQAEHFKPEFHVKEAEDCGRYFAGQFETLIKRYTRLHGQPPYWIRDMKPDHAYQLFRTSVACNVPLPTDADAHHTSTQDPAN